MTYIKNFNVDDDIVSFEIDNHLNRINISLVNSIRRTIISDIEAYIIDGDTVKIYSNTSILDNQFLIHRLKLIPIISNLEDVNYDNLIISCKKNNEAENMEGVYVKDFNNDKIFKYPGILFAKIKNNQEIIFEAKLMKNNAERGGSFYSTVSKCVYIFKMNSEKINELTKNMNETEKRSFNTLEAERIYTKNDNGYPDVYQFTIESIGFYEPTYILKMGLKLLMKRLNMIKYELNNKDSKKIKIVYKDDNSNFHYFLMDDENETIGNLLQTYIVNNKNVEYCGFVIEHPLKKNILLKIQLNNNNSIENTKLIIEENIDYINNIINDMYNEIMIY